MFQSKRQKKVSLIVFGIYVLLLIWLILFKFSTGLNELPYLRNINLIPFKESLIINGRLRLSEIIYNVLVFVPFGVYISIFKYHWSFIKRVMMFLGISLLFEVLQFIFAIGVSDITDIINNTIGAILGIGVCVLFEKMFKQRFISIVNFIGLAIETMATIMLMILL